MGTLFHRKDEVILANLKKIFSLDEFFSNIPVRGAVIGEEEKA